MNMTDTNCNWHAMNYPQRIGKETGRIGNKRTIGNHPHNSSVEIGQNTEKSPEDEETFCHSKSGEKPPANTGMKNSQKSKKIIIEY